MGGRYLLKPHRQVDPPFQGRSPFGPNLLFPIAASKPAGLRAQRKFGGEI